MVTPLSACLLALCLTRPVILCVVCSSVDLTGNGSWGRLQDSLTQLTALSHLSLRGNAFVGTLPPGLTALTSLTFVSSRIESFSRIT
jgi:hypothetical protein